jgi:Uma2 family endonuclease
MSLATFPSTAPPLQAVPSRVQWTVAEFHRLLADPAYEQRRMFLAEGEILEMPNPNPPHNTSLLLANEALRTAFGPPFCMRIQMPLVLNQKTDPMPDLAVVPGSPRDYADHPNSALLVVEVADSSLAYDSRDKANLYAASGIQEYWVVDLTHRKLLVFRDPAPDPSRPFGACYRTATTHEPAAVVAPLAASQASIKVGDLLP